jgi:hypothetical protein
MNDTDESTLVPAARFFEPESIASLSERVGEIQQAFARIEKAILDESLVLLTFGSVVADVDRLAGEGGEHDLYGATGADVITHQARVLRGLLVNLLDMGSDAAVMHAMGPLAP